MSTKFGLLWANRCLVCYELSLPSEGQSLWDFDLLKAAISTNAKPEIAFSVHGRHLDKAIWRYMSAVGAPIWTKFSRLMQNKMQITEKCSRSEPEVEFQYGERLFFQTRSSYFSAIIWYADHWCRRNLVCLVVSVAVAVAVPLAVSPASWGTTAATRVPRLRIGEHPREWTRG